MVEAWGGGLKMSGVLQGPLCVRGRGQRRPAQICGVQMDVQLQTCQEHDLQGAQTRHCVPGMALTRLVRAKVLLTQQKTVPYPDASVCPPAVSSGDLLRDQSQLLAV